MRFRQLELVRYGGFADRVFDFGEDQPDLHLIVGPNEAGKSTTLQAIGDLLFGIPERSAQNWRYEYSQLRLRALIEHEGVLVDVTRRKGKRDTLLDADGTPFAHDPLLPLLGGLDRAGFERMFGLDHAKLRLGGESILGGRDDAARITLEAGTGVSNIGKELSRLTETASELFKSGGQNPPVNRLMRERAEALAQVRLTSISDAEWTQSRQRRAQAEERRAALIDEAEALEREQARLDRVGRARAPSARLASARGELAELASLPDLPLGAAERLISDRAERLTVIELKDQLDADIRRVDTAIAAIEVPGDVVSFRDRIEALEERRPVIAKAVVDLERRRAELERIDARITSVRSEARIAPSATLPSAGWRRRAGVHLEARHQAKSRETASQKESLRLNRDRERIERGLAALGSDKGLAELTSALASHPADSDRRLEAADLEAVRKRTLAAERLANLQPWQGPVESLRVLSPPSEAAAVEVRRALETALANVTAARKDRESAEANAIRTQAKLAGLIANGPVPTAEAVAAVRQVRDEHVRHVRERLLAPRSPDDEKVGRDLVDAIVNADQLADRRDAEAARVAEFALATSAADEAKDLIELSSKREEIHREELEQIEKRWSSNLHALGFEGPILPAEFAGWLTKRLAALDAERESSSAKQIYDALKAQILGARATIAKCLILSGGVDTTVDDPALIERAHAHVVDLGSIAATRAHFQTELQSLNERLSHLRDEAADLARERAELEEVLENLIVEAGLPNDANETVVADALEILVQINEDTGAHDSISRQVKGIEQDRLAFETELAEILASLAIPRKGEAIDQTRELAQALRGAVRREEALVAHVSDRERLVKELERLRHRLGKAVASIEEVMRLTGADNDAELDQIIAGIGRRDAARSRERDALAELAGTDNGAGHDALALEIAALPSEVEAADRARIEDRRREVAAEREVVGRTLNAADDEAARAATESAAADAQQIATDTTAALAQAAEEHIQAVTAAALLRWMLDRHRATNQAPLIARAGALFKQVTGGAFTGLTIGYANDDRPVILANRANGAEVGVEALSEGTRDQLYLALRLGSIEGRAGVGALPVVCDDLLITADDERSVQLLKVLASAAEQSQVIIFSHHAHLIDIARRAVGPNGFKLHVIEPSPAEAA